MKSSSPCHRFCVSFSILVTLLGEKGADFFAIRCACAFFFTLHLDVKGWLRLILYHTLDLMFKYNVERVPPSYNVTLFILFFYLVFLFHISLGRKSDFGRLNSYFRFVLMPDRANAAMHDPQSGTLR